MMKKVCSGTMIPDITIDNLGYETINSLVINVSVNETALTQLEWNGVIEPGRSAKIYFDELNFGFDDSNNMSFEITQINGAPDDYAPSVYNYSFEASELVYNKSFKLTLRTDNNPEAITWDIVNTATGEVVLNGGPYDQVHHMYNQDFDLDASGCYKFTIYDAMGNGLASGNGLYGLKAGSTTLFSGANFNDKESNEFSFSKYEDIEEAQINAINIYPNPSNGIVTIDVANNGMMRIFNTTGQMVVEQKIDGKTMLDLSDLEKGTYLMVFTDKYGESNKQVIVLQ